MEWRRKDEEKERCDERHNGIRGIWDDLFIYRRTQIMKEQFMTTDLAHFISIVQVRLLS